MKATIALLLGLAWGCGTHIERPHATDADSDVDSDTDADSDSDSVTDIPPADLRLTRVEPTHGPWTGGTPVDIRGDGFSVRGEPTIEFDGRPVDPLDIYVVSPQQLRVLVGPGHLGIPAGDVGPADIRVTVKDLDDEAAPRREVVLPGGGDFGYTYDSFYVEPPRGTVTGRTKVSLFGTSTLWDASAVVTFDGAPATDCDILSATRIDCKTPPGEPGGADVEVAGGEGPAAFDDEVKDGFEYYNAADPIGGGLGGGPLDGQMNVTVLDVTTLLPVVGAFVMIGIDGATPYQGLTNALGQIVFEGDDLVGRHQVSAGHEGFESTSFVSFDARDVTIFLVPIPPPSPPPPPPPREPARLTGVLIFDGPNEFGPNPWVIIPDPRVNEAKVCYVSTTKPDLYHDAMTPGDGGRVLEVDPERVDFGHQPDEYYFDIWARPSALAAWALCGLEAVDEGNLAIDEENGGYFIPYAMGVRRNIIAAPGDVLEDQDIHVNIPLDHLAIANLECTPEGSDAGPDRYRVDTYIDLGGEGLIGRDDASVLHVDPAADFRFGAQPPLMSDISDAQFWFVGGGYTGVDERNPFSVAIEKGIFDLSEPITIGDFLGVPDLIDPPYAGTVENNTFTWESLGCGTSTFNMVIINTAEAIPIPVWRVFVEGTVTSIELPDLELIGGLPPIPDAQYFQASIWEVYVQDLDWNQFSYTYAFGQNYWKKYSADGFIFQY